jgi:hypothetical protein
MPMHDPITGAQVQVNDDRSLSVSTRDPVSGARMGVGADGSLFVAPHPKGATPISASSGNVAAAVATATLAGAASKTTYIAGFTCTSGGATAAATVSVTVSNTIGGTMTFNHGAQAGAGVPSPPLVVIFDPPLPANALNTAIAVSMPSLGTGNTQAAVNAWGYQL